VWYKSERLGRRDKALLVVPEHLRERIIQAARLTREAGHGGIQHTTEHVQLSYWWPALKQDVDNFIKKCERCQTSSKTPMPAKAPLQLLPICSEPNDRIHIDLFTDVRQRSGAKHICVMTDAFSKYTEMVCMESKFANVVARAFFERWICRFSVPKLLMSDQGREFDNKVMDELCLIFGVKKKRTSPYHPEAVVRLGEAESVLHRLLPVGGILQHATMLSAGQGELGGCGGRAKGIFRPQNKGEDICGRRHLRQATG
jgi:hypothetical protein